MQSLLLVATLATAQPLIINHSGTPDNITIPTPMPINPYGIAEGFRTLIARGDRLSNQEWWTMLTSAMGSANFLTRGYSICMGEQSTVNRTTYTESFTPQTTLSVLVYRAAGPTVSPQVYNAIYPEISNGTTPGAQFRDSYVNQTWPWTYNGVQGVFKWKDSTTDTMFSNPVCGTRGFFGNPAQTQRAYELVWEDPSGMQIRSGLTLPPPFAQESYRPGMCISTISTPSVAPWGTTRASAQQYVQGLQECRTSDQFRGAELGFQRSTREVVITPRETCIPEEREGPEGQQIYVQQGAFGNWQSYYIRNNSPLNQTPSPPNGVYEDGVYDYTPLNLEDFELEIVYVPCTPRIVYDREWLACEPADSSLVTSNYDQCEIDCSTVTSTNLSCTVTNRLYSWVGTPPLTRSGVANATPDGFLRLSRPYTAGRYLITPSSPPGTIGECLVPAYDRVPLVEVVQATGTAAHAAFRASRPNYLGDVICMAF